MGAEHHTSIKKLFLLYVLGAVGITALLSLYIEERLVLYLYAMIQHYNPVYKWKIYLLIGLILLVPPSIFIATLVLAAFLFGRRMVRWYNPPLRELREAVEKIKQQDLNFFINYNAPDELGDLCRAVNELRSKLQISLLREWGREEEAREMVATLSHDLRTPVAILQGHIESLANAGPEKRVQRLERYLPALEGNVQRLTRLLNDMMMASSLEQSGFTLQPRPVNPEQVLSDKAEAYTLRCAEHNISFRFQAYKLPEMNDKIDLDIHRIEQVLDNLFENALRLTPSGGVITLTWAWNRNALSFSMSDTGPGISTQDLPYIFEKYYSGSGRESESKKSMGLGLYICKTLVESYGGSIAARNLPEGGCEVSFWIVLDHVYREKEPVHNLDSCEDHNFPLHSLRRSAALSFSEGSEHFSL